MAMDNVQTVDRSQTVKKEDKEKTIYSINLKQSTVDKAKKLMAKRDELIAQLNANVAEGVERGATTEQLVGSNMVIAANIGELEKKINILSAMQGPVETQGTRALRLIQKMIKEVKRKSDIIYAVDDKKEEIVPEPTPGEASVIVEVPAVSVQHIATANGQAVGQSIENAINDGQTSVAPVSVESTDEVPINQSQTLPANTVVEQDVVSPIVQVQETVSTVETPVEVASTPVVEVPVEAVAAPVVETPVEVASTPVVEVPVVEEPTTEVINLEEQNRINNETMQNYASENEYIPMTDEEVADSQRKLAEDAIRSEEARHQRLLAEEARKAKEVETINESKGFDFATVPEVVTEPEIEMEFEEPLRDEIEIVPERVGSVEVKEIEEQQPVLVEEDTEKDGPRWESVKPEEKENLVSHREESIEELYALIKEAQAEADAKQKEKDKSAEELKDLKDDYNRLIENEKAAEERLEELKKEAEKKDKELADKKEELKSRLETIRDNNSSIDDDIKKYREEFESIKHDGDERNSRLEHLNSEADSVQKNISEIDDMLKKYGDVGETYSGYQKIV